MFAVVKWLENDQRYVSVVPTNWLVRKDNKDYSSWPLRAADESVVKKRREPGSDWPKYAVKILSKAGWKCHLIS